MSESKRTADPPDAMLDRLNRAVSEALAELDKQIAEDLAEGTQFHPDYFRTYPNGCPILESE